LPKKVKRNKSVILKNICKTAKKIYKLENIAYTIKTTHLKYAESVTAYLLDGILPFKNYDTLS